LRLVGISGIRGLKRVPWKKGGGNTDQKEEVTYVGRTSDLNFGGGEGKKSHLKGFVLRKKK